MFKSKGELILISGPMYAGKSRQLIELYRELEKQGANQIAFRPSFDTRTATIESRAGGTIPSVEIKDVEGFVKHIKEYEVIFIDEFHFFDEELMNEIIKWQKKGKNFIISGLDKDFMKDNFKEYNFLKKHATQEIKMTAICHSCGRVAKYSRKQNAENTENRIELDNGGNETQYFSSCELCHPVK